ncbi:hypothetical protein [Rhodococcus sp. OK302]|uniref:hypothetical protein n=1 Tax=Rhodococcus sp. OK302 TaxID=1882769 RepID=UPI000B93A61E|nr:hypothetical protein [Rhodococcus sp. OK302]OYD61209.1 hypothetical protein BDB13_6166 [Rhodococcus sp. OK302]
MAIPTYMVTHSSGNMSFGSDGVAEGMAKRLPRNLDGIKRSYIILEKLPRPAWPDNLTTAERASMGRTYCQCAGSAEGLAVEVSIDDESGRTSYAIGHGGPRDGEPDHGIPYNNGTSVIPVYADEVLTPDEATEILLSYIKTGAIPPRFITRALTLPPPTQENTAPF